MKSPLVFFCSLEKCYFIEKTIKCIKLKDGECITDQKKIVTRVRKFYLNLFSQKQGSQEIQHNEFLKNLNTKKLTKEESDTLEGNLTMEEIGQALKQITNV